MKCFYHTDMDGHCAAAIVVKYMKLQEDDGTGFKYIPIDYKDEFPFRDIRPNEEVIIVDFSLQKDGDFEKLLKITSRVIWIDHHKTALEKYEILYKTIKGLRQDGISACELTWSYFFPHLIVPRVVELLGDYDIWTFKYGEETNYLQTGIKLYDISPESDNWNRWLDSLYDPIQEIEEGSIALRYRSNQHALLVKHWSFETVFEGYKAIACNVVSASSQLFDSIPTEEYALMIAFGFDGEQWSISLYTKRPDIDVSEIAKRYGGGGHRQAAGFQSKELLIKKKADLKNLNCQENYSE